MNFKGKGDGLSEAIERLRAELSVIKEEIRVIDIRRPALESRVTRIQEALTTLIGDGSTGDPRWMAMPRVTEHGLAADDPYGMSSPSSAPRVHKSKAGPLHKPEITEEAILAMAAYIHRADRDVKSSELYEYLVKEGKLAPIETEMPYKSFAITLRNIHQDLIEYSRSTKTWALRDRSPKAKLREAMEKGDGTRVVSSHSAQSDRAEHLFVKVLTGIFHENHDVPAQVGRLYDELSEKREFGLIPGVGNLTEFTASLRTYGDFFTFDEASGFVRIIKSEVTRQPEAPAAPATSGGAPGLYTVKSSTNYNS